MNRLPALPIDAAIPEILAALAEAGAAVVVAPPGTGKTTRLPPAILDSGLLGSGVCLVLEPRRIAARAAARRVAEERRTVVGEEVGYITRFDRMISARTRILFVTEGIFMVRLQADPTLEGVSAVVLDEFHERSLEVDLALGFLREVRAGVRPDLKIAVLSATLPPGPAAEYLKARVVEIEGVLHRVDLRYLDRPDSGPLPERWASAVRRAWRERAASRGDILVFLPGAGEIRRTAEILSPWAGEAGGVVLPLHGDLPAEAQDAVLTVMPGQAPRVILATNIAETSLTIEGVSTVVDSGLEKVLRHDPALGLDRLEVSSISRQSADQRAGRAGRQGPGAAYRLWTRHDDLSRPARGLPEVQRADLSRAVLEILAWGSTPEAFPWFERPPPDRISAARELLGQLQAVDPRGHITPLGEVIRRLPVHPRLARMVIDAKGRGLLRQGAALAALASERDILLAGRAFSRLARRRGREEGAGPSDLLDRLELLEQAESAGFGAPGLASQGVDPGAARAAARARDQMVSLAERVEDPPDPSEAKATDPPGASLEERLLRLILRAYPDRVARRRSAGSDRFLLMDGSGAALSRESTVTRAELVVAVRLDPGQRRERSESLIRWASRIEPGWLDELGGVTQRLDTRFDDEGERVVATEARCYGELRLDERPAAPDADRAAQLLAEAAGRNPERVLRPNRSAQTLIRRCRFLARAMPELGFPTWDAEDWRQLLEELCQGRKSFDELRRVELAGALRSRLTREQLQALDRHAPERVEVPSGSRISLEYPEDGPPALAVKIQEVFGWPEGPRVAGGRVGVALHLLGPHGRPLQVTADLGSFWRSGYEQVRKEMKGRYPKHFWPEDPWTAAPTRRTTAKPGKRPSS